MTRTEIRVSAIIVQDSKIVLIHRKKDGQEYWVLPGGHVEDGESPEAALTREVKEETGRDLLSSKVAFYIDMHPVYSCRVDSGNLIFTGPELANDPAVDWYNPEWVSVKLLPTLTIYPESVKEKLMTAL